MRHIDNIVIKSFCATPTTMEVGSNRQFKRQREEHPEYDQYLINLDTLLKKEESEDALRVRNTLEYHGNVFAIIRDVMPYINDMYNAGLSEEECLHEIKNGTWKTKGK